MDKIKLKVKIPEKEYSLRYFVCPRLSAKVTVSYCISLRGRPTLNDFVRGKLKMPRGKAKERSLKPLECEDCNFFLKVDSQEVPTLNLQNMKNLRWTQR